MRKAFHAVALAIAGLLGYIAATPYLPQPEEQFYERAIACLVDAVIPSSEAAVFGPVDAFTPAFGGRCTLTTGTPVMTATVASATVIYYTPYNGGNRIALYNGTKLVNYVFGELSNTTTATSVGSAGPAAVAANSVYDLYVWNSAGTLRLTRSPAWATAVTRGTGAGTAQQDCTTVPGVCTNAVAITNGPAANRGTFVGTFASDPGSTIDYQFGALAASGTAAVLNVWNQHNRVQVGTTVADTGDSWQYTTAALRSSNNATTMRVTYVVGAAEDDVYANFSQELFGSISGSLRCGIAVGVDSVTVGAGIPWQQQWLTATTTARQVGTAIYVGNPGLGSHFLQALEYGGTTCTFEGDGGAATVIQNGLQVRLRQ